MWHAELVVPFGFAVPACSLRERGMSCPCYMSSTTGTWLFPTLSLMSPVCPKPAIVYFWFHLFFFCLWVCWHFKFILAQTVNFSCADIWKQWFVYLCSVVFFSQLFAKQILKKNHFNMDSIMLYKNTCETKVVKIHKMNSMELLLFV